jgi:hypothetical protein
MGNATLGCSTETYPSHLKIISGLFVNIELLNPWGTELLISIASFKVCTKHKPHLSRIMKMITCTFTVTADNRSKQYIKT